jgi:hypothetical protein
MEEYIIVVRYAGEKVFRVKADSIEDVHDIIRQGPEHYTNPETDTVDENIVSIEKVESK